MKTILFLACVFCVSGASAQESCGKSKNALTDIKTLCDGLNKKNEVHCKVAVAAKKESVAPITYGIMSASNKMKSLFEKMDSMQRDFLQESGGCPGGCSKVTAPVVEIATRPTAVESDPACPASYMPVKLNSSELLKFGVTQTDGYFKRSFRMRGDAKKCQEQASDFAQDTLMGDNNLGSYLEDQKCQSPCSYSSVIRMKTQSLAEGECGVDLELSVQCGPPKKDREWTTQASLTKAFRCEVGQ